MFSPFLTTGIGSLPHTDPEEACGLILATFDIPFWPQLPQLSFRESMILQFSEGYPSLKVDEKKENLWVERNGDELSKFYEDYSEDWRPPISARYAKGLDTFLKAIHGKHFDFLKGHVTGPLTFSLGLKDSKGRLAYFDEELREIVLIVLKAKIKWQVELLRDCADRIVIFIDEPVLSALGTSSYIGVAPEEALRLLRETADAVREAGGISGIHCCSKADWPLVINSGVDIVSFDAYDYVETISLYPAEFTAFLKKGGRLAWGIVPTTESIRDEDAGSINGRFRSGVEKLSGSIPEDLLLSQILLTPSCGTGTRTVKETEKIFKILVELKEMLKETYS